MWQDWVHTTVLFLPVGLLVLGLLVWVMLRKTIRTRTRVARQLREGPDISEWIVTFNWSRKVLYIPTILASVTAAALMQLHSVDLLGLGHKAVPEIIGGVWLGIFFLNFLVDEYEMTVKVLLIGLLCLLAVFLWLGFFRWVDDVLGWFRHLGVRIDALGYLLLAAVFIVAIVVSWIRGQFYYVAITPNYLNLQVGPTETGEQIHREGYSTRIDTGDFLERLFGFGRVVITFRDHRRLPMQLLVARIGRVAKRLESIHGKLTFDQNQPAPADNIE